MDVGRNQSSREAIDGDKNITVQFALNAGLTSSALEHVMPQQMFSNHASIANSISAVKALQIANEQEIPIYTINKNNINNILQYLQVDSDVKADIQNAVNAGKEVTVSKSNINFNVWTGCGYIIIDPTTGDGAYMINGGLSGSWGEYYFWNTVYVFSLSIHNLSNMALEFFVGYDENLLSPAELEVAKKCTPANCSYLESLTTVVLKDLGQSTCIAAGDCLWSNIVRYGVKKDFAMMGESSEWYLEAHIKWFYYAAIIYIDAPEEERNCF